VTYFSLNRSLWNTEKSAKPCSKNMGFCWVETSSILIFHLIRDFYTPEQRFQVCDNMLFFGDVDGKADVKTKVEKDTCDCLEDRHLSSQ
jgi:hypothetical protein